MCFGGPTAGGMAEVGGIHPTSWSVTSTGSGATDAPYKEDTCALQSSYSPLQVVPKNAIFKAIESFLVSMSNLGNEDLTDTTAGPWDIDLSLG